MDPTIRITDFVGGSMDALPLLIADLQTALAVAYVVVAFELLAIAWVRRRFLRVALSRSLIQVALGGVTIAVVGAIVGHA